MIHERVQDSVMQSQNYMDKAWRKRQWVDHVSKLYLHDRSKLKPLDGLPMKTGYTWKYIRVITHKNKTEKLVYTLSCRSSSSFTAKHRYRTVTKLMETVDDRDLSIHFHVSINPCRLCDTHKFSIPICIGQIVKSNEILPFALSSSLLPLHHIDLSLFCNLSGKKPFRPVSTWRCPQATRWRRRIRTYLTSDEILLL